MERLQERTGMKTLDEVIKANECCDHGEPDSRCEDCPYNGLGACCAERESDALHYLKEYRRLQTAYIRAMADLEDNPPLSWDELRTMEGKPVWVEVKYQNPDAIYKYWTIVKYFDSHEGEDLVFTGTGFYHRSLLGTGWQVYRKERI